MLNTDCLNLKALRKRIFVSSKGMRSACSYERSEVEFRYNDSKDTKTFYHILLKMIRGLISSKTKSRLKIRLTYLEP